MKMVISSMIGRMIDSRKSGLAFRPFIYCLAVVEDEKNRESCLKSFSSGA